MRREMKKHCVGGEGKRTCEEQGKKVRKGEGARWVCLTCRMGSSRCDNESPGTYIALKTSSWSGSPCGESSVVGRRQQKLGKSRQPHVTHDFFRVQPRGGCDDV